VGEAADPGVVDASRVLDLEASLRRDQRRWAEALALLDQALTSSPNPERSGRILLTKAFTHEQRGDCEEAIAALEAAAPLVDPARDPRQAFGLRFNLAVNLCHLGRYAEAVPRVAEARELAVALRNDLDLVRLLWIEGRLAAGLGRRAEAIAALRQVREDFAERELAADAALVTLNLAVELLEDGRTREVRQLAGETVPIFGNLGLGDETLAALAVFWQAALHEQATAELGRRLLAFLERARHDPELRFDSDGKDELSGTTP
jgi:tetratricopeptide (TPR) repeat protein